MVPVEVDASVHARTARFAVEVRVIEVASGEAGDRVRFSRSAQRRFRHGYRDASSDR